MDRWQKNLAVWLVVVLALPSVTSLVPKVTGAQINPTYGGTKNNGDQLDIEFSEYNNSVIYLGDQNWINFSIGFDRYSFDYMNLGGFIYSVTYKASWLSESVAVYNWSYHDPANLKDDDPNPQTSFQGTISLNDAPVGNQQVTVNALAGDYATDFSTYCIYTADTSSILNFTIAGQRPETPRPTFSNDSGIQWRTDIPWNLTGTPAERIWASNIRGESRDWTAPVVVNGVVYAGATSSVTLNQYGSPQISWIDVYAFGAKNGEQIWDYQATFSSTTALAVADGRVYFGAEADFYYVEGDVNATEGLNALDASSGKLLWSTPCSIFYSTPITENGKVFINSDHSVLALDSADGKILWNYTANDIIVSSPTVANGVLYVSSNDKTLYALNARDSSEIWSAKTDKGFSGFRVANGAVYAASGDGKIYAYNAATGDELWSKDAAPPEFSWVNSSSCSAPIYYAGSLYFTGWSEQSLEDAHVGIRGVCFSYDKTYVYALNVGTHNKLWNYTVDNFEFGNPVIVSDGVVFTEVNQRIIGFNSQNGAVIWNFTNADLWPNTQPTVANGSIYVGFSDGQLYALRAPTLDIQTGNQGAASFYEDQHITLLIVVIAVVIALTSLTTSVLLYGRKRSEQKRDL